MIINITKEFISKTILCHARRFLSGIHVFVNIGFLPKTRRNDNTIICFITYELISKYPQTLVCAIRAILERRLKPAARLFYCLSFPHAFSGNPEEDCGSQARPCRGSKF